MPINNPHRTKVDATSDAAKLGIREHPGWTGLFTRRQSPKAGIANGTKIKKINSEPSDLVKDGTTGKILGSIDAGPFVGYFVEWDICPCEAIFIVPWKIQRTNNANGTQKDTQKTSSRP